MEGRVPNSHLHAAFLESVHSNTGCTHLNRNAATFISSLTNGFGSSESEAARVLWCRCNFYHSLLTLQNMKSGRLGRISVGTLGHGDAFIELISQNFLLYKGWDIL